MRPTYRISETYNINTAGTVAFDFNFKLEKPAHLLIVERDSDEENIRTFRGNETAHVQSVVNQANPDFGGRVTLVTAPANGNTLYLFLDDSEPVQIDDYSAKVKINPDSIESSLDKASSQIQTNRADIDRSIKYIRGLQNIVTEIPRLSEGETAVLGPGGVQRFERSPADDLTQGQVDKIINRFSVNGRILTLTAIDGTVHTFTGGDVDESGNLIEAIASPFAGKKIRIALKTTNDFTEADILAGTEVEANVNVALSTPALSDSIPASATLYMCFWINGEIHSQFVAMRGTHSTATLQIFGDPVEQEADGEAGFKYTTTISFYRLTFSTPEPYVFEFKLPAILGPKGDKGDPGVPGAPGSGSGTVDRKSVLEALLDSNPSGGNEGFFNLNFDADSSELTEVTQAGASVALFPFSVNERSLYAFSFAGKIKVETPQPAYKFLIIRRSFIPGGNELIDDVLHEVDITVNSLGFYSVDLSELQNHRGLGLINIHIPSVNELNNLYSNNNVPNYWYSFGLKRVDGNDIVIPALSIPDDKLFSYKYLSNIPETSQKIFYNFEDVIPQTSIDFYANSTPNSAAIAKTTNRLYPCILNYNSDIQSQFTIRERDSINDLNHVIELVEDIEILSNRNWANVSSGQTLKAIRVFLSQPINSILTNNQNWATSYTFSFDDLALDYAVIRIPKNLDIRDFRINRTLSNSTEESPIDINRQRIHTDGVNNYYSVNIPHVPGSTIILQEEGTAATFTGYRGQVNITSEQIVEGFNNIPDDDKPAIYHPKYAEIGYHGLASINDSLRAHQCVIFRSITTDIRINRIRVKLASNTNPANNSNSYTVSIKRVVNATATTFTIRENLFEESITRADPYVGGTAGEVLTIRPNLRVNRLIVLMLMVSRDEPPTNDGRHTSILHNQQTQLAGPSQWSTIWPFADATLTRYDLTNLHILPNLYRMTNNAIGQTTSTANDIVNQFLAFDMQYDDILTF